MGCGIVTSSGVLRVNLILRGCMLIEERPMLNSTGPSEIFMPVRDSSARVGVASR